MGKSSTGKDTIFRLLRKKHPEWQMITLYTTRPIRKGETQGNEYHFVTDSYVRELEQAGKIIEQRSYDTIHGIWKYVTADDGLVDLSKHTYLTIGTLESYLALRSHYGTEALLPIYIEVEDGIRLERALKREQKQEQPKYEEMCRRFLADSIDFSEERLCEAEIHTRFVNDQLEACLKEINQYIYSQV